MKKVILLAVVAVFVGAGVASAYDLNAYVTTDKAVYAPGERVYWEMFAWTSSDCPGGIALLALNLLEDQGEVLESADVELFMGFVPQLTNTGYGAAVGFTIGEGPGGTPEPTGGLLADITEYQSIVRLEAQGAHPDVGNTGQAVKFAQGDYEVNIMGMHHLSITVNGANYWPGPSVLDMAPDPPVWVRPNAEPLELGSITGADFEVIPEPATMGLLLLGVVALIRRRR